LTGATLANSAAVAAARNELLRREGWDVEANGLFGAPEIQVVIGAEAHSGVLAALRYNGLGAERVHRIPTNLDGVIDVRAFENTIAELSGPILVILQAGHINSGAFDPFNEIIPLAHKKNAWVHVDGAFGLWLRCVPHLASRLAGVEYADSWAVDLHKWLNAPFDAGMVITRHCTSLSRALSARGTYLPEVGEAGDPCDHVFELSRRARGVPSYAILRSLGKSGVREMVSRHCHLAQHIARRLAAEPGITVLNEIHANQIAIRCGDGVKADSLTQATLKQIQQEGIVYPSHGKWRDVQIIRISIVAYGTQLMHADRVANGIIRAWKNVQKSNATK
jgi:glutamate/tyrosine decarboxylase-like PLP-dependent enzyme